MTKYLSLCVNIRNVYLMNRQRTTKKRTDLDAPITCPFHSLCSGTERIDVWSKLRLCTDYVLSELISVICRCTYLIKTSKVALLSLVYVPSSKAWWKEHQEQRRHRRSFQPPPQGSFFPTYVTPSTSCDSHELHKRNYPLIFQFNLTGGLQWMSSSRGKLQQWD